MEKFDSKPMNPPALVDGKVQEQSPLEEPALREVETPIEEPTLPSAAEVASGWRAVAAQAAAETDPTRLSQLVDELIRLLDEERRGKTSLE